MKPATVRVPADGSRFTSAAALWRGIMDAAASLPEIPAEILASWTPAEIHRKGWRFPAADGTDPGPWRFEFAYQLAGARGSLTVNAASRARLQVLAETVRRSWAAFGGGVKPEEITKPRQARRRDEFPAGQLRAWADMVAEGMHADALACGDTLGARFYPGTAEHGAFIIAGPQPVEGLPDGFASGMRDDRRFCVFHLASGGKLGETGATRKAAEANALQYLADMVAKHGPDALERAIERAPVADQAAARADWMRRRGLTPPEVPAEEIPPPAAEEETAPPPAADLAGFVAIAADSIARLRAVDVHRVIAEAPAARRDELAGWIRTARPDLAGDLADALADLSAPEDPPPAAPPAREIPPGAPHWRGPAGVRVYAVHLATAETARQLYPGPAGPCDDNPRQHLRARRAPEWHAPEVRAMRAAIAAAVRAARAALRAPPPPPPPPPPAPVPVPVLAGADDRERAELERAALARFGVRDLQACQHLPAFPAWHAETLARIRGGPPPDGDPPPAAPPPDPGAVRRMLGGILPALARASPGGIPSPDALEREAARVAAAGLAMGGRAPPQLAAQYRETAAALRELASIEAARLAGDRRHPAAGPPWPAGGAPPGRRTIPPSRIRPPEETPRHDIETLPLANPLARGSPHAPRLPRVRPGVGLLRSGAGAGAGSRRPGAAAGEAWTPQHPAHAAPHGTRSRGDLARRGRGRPPGGGLTPARRCWGGIAPPVRAPAGRRARPRIRPPPVLCDRRRRRSRDSPAADRDGAAAALWG